MQAAKKKKKKSPRPGHKIPQIPEFSQRSVHKTPTQATTESSAPQETLDSLPPAQFLAASCQSRGTTLSCLSQSISCVRFVVCCDFLVFLDFQDVFSLRACSTCIREAFLLRAGTLILDIRPTWHTKRHSVREY